MLEITLVQLIKVRFQKTRIFSMNNFAVRENLLQNRQHRWTDSHKSQTKFYLLQRWNLNPLWGLLLWSCTCRFYSRTHMIAFGAIRKPCCSWRWKNACVSLVGGNHVEKKRIRRFGRWWLLWKKASGCKVCHHIFIFHQKWPL